MILLFVLLLYFVPVSAWATDRYLDQSTTGCSIPSDNDYDPTTRVCGSGSELVYNTADAVMAAHVGGDNIYIRAGTYTGSSNGFYETMKSGTVDKRTEITSFQGESVTIQPSGLINVFKFNSHSYIRVAGLKIYGDNVSGHTIKILNNSDWLILENNDISDHQKGANPSFTCISGGGTATVHADDVQILNNLIHDCGETDQSHGIYPGYGDRWIVRHNKVYNNSGYGLHVYPHSQNWVIDDNEIFNNVTARGCCAQVLLADIGHTFVNNKVYNTGTVLSSECIQTEYGAGGDNMLIVNNTLYNCGSIYGVYMPAGASGNTVQNNIIIGSPTPIFTANGTHTLLTNRTTGVITDCTISTSDLRLKAGTNPCRDAGTAHALRPAPVGAPDIGAYEQGIIASAAVVSSFIEVTVNVMTPGVLPASGITGWTATCVGCTGSPVVAPGTVKVGANNIVLLTISGLSTSGTCTLSYSNGNMTDSLIIGTQETGTAQLVNSVSGLSVSGTCSNSAGGGGTPGGLKISHDVNEGSGTSLNDLTANNLDSTLSGSPTWITPGFEGSALSFAPGVDQRVTFQWGNAINPTTQSFTFCALIKPNVGMGNRIIMGTANGTNQRMYIGSSNGQTLQLGVGSSGHSSSVQSEFPVVTTWTHACITNDASVDTVYLSINGVRGTSAASVKSTTGMTALASNFLIGCGHFTGTTVCGGFSMDQPKIWDVALTQAEVLAEFNSLTPAGPSLACYSQGAFQAEAVIAPGGTPEVLTLSPDGAVEVVSDGAVAFKVDLKCTGSAGLPISVRPYYSLDGVTFSLPIPDVFGSDLISMYGLSSEPFLNSGVSTGCVNATGLTPNNGSSVLTSVTSPTATLSQDHCISFRLLVRVGNIVNQTRTIRWHQDNGALLAGAYPGSLPKIRVVPNRIRMK